LVKELGNLKYGIYGKPCLLIPLCPSLRSLKDLEKELYAIDERYYQWWTVIQSL